MPRVKPPLGSLIDFANPLARGLSGAWEFSEGAGARVVDSSGRNRHGTLNGGVIWTPGRDGPALDFDGASGYIGCGPAIPISPEFAVECWYYSTAAADNSQRIVTNGNNTWELYANSSANLASFAVEYPPYPTASALISPGWNHLLGQRNNANGNLELWVNGSLAATTACVAPSIAASGNLEIGRFSGSGLYTRGQIGRVRTWSRSLSSGEIGTLYSDGHSLFPPPSVRRFFGAMGGGASPQAVTPTGISSAEALGTPAISPGAVSLAPAGITSAEAFGSPAIGIGALTLSPSGITSGESFGSPNLTPGSVTLSPSGVGSAESFGALTVIPGPATILPSGIASAESFGVPSLTATAPGAVTISPAGIDSAEALGTPTITPGAATIAPTGIASGEAVGSPAITPGVVALSPAGIGSAEAFGSPTITASAPGTVTLSPVGIPSTEVFGSPTITAGPITISPTGITSREAFGSPTIGPAEPEDLADDLLTAIQDAFLVSAYADVIPGGMGAVEGTAGQPMPYAMIREKSTRTELMTDTSQIDALVLCVRVYADDLDVASDLGIELKDLFEGQSFAFAGGQTTLLTRLGDPRHDRAHGYARGGVPLWYQERTFHCRVKRPRGLT